MSKTSKQRVHHVGLSPGTLMLPPGTKTETTEISLLHWTDQQLERAENVQPGKLKEWVNKPGTTWIQVEGIRDIDTLRELGLIFSLHPLMLEDILNPTQRPKLDDYDNLIYISIQLLHYDSANLDLDDEQISIIIAKNYIITFVETANTLFAPIHKRLANQQSRVRHHGPDYLAYALIDLIVDYSFITIDSVGTYLDEFEVSLLKKPPQDAPTTIQRLKRLIGLLRIGFHPIREVVHQFQRLDSPWIEKATKFYLHDVSDHVFQGLDMIDSFRDTSHSLLDIYHSYLNQKMNDVMRTLTVVATIFVPLTFISSLYGMNFSNMPELSWAWGYPLTLSIMVSVAVGMLIYFRRKDWI